MSTTSRTASASASSAPKGIDPRGPRFAAGVTLVIAVAALVAALVTPIASTPVARAVEPGTILTTILFIAFAAGTLGGPQRNPFGLLFKAFVRPRLAAPAELEDPRPPRFAQGIGLVLSLAGIVLHLAGVPWALVIAVAFIVVASFLNSVVNFCLGCQLYLLLARAGILGRSTASA
jgi:hypothetical protein